MADSITNTIDRVFDLVDSGVDKIDLLLNRRGRGQGLPRDRGKESSRGGGARGSMVIDTTTVVKGASPDVASKFLAAARFRVVETVDPSSSQVVFVVTDGGAARVSCNSRSLANKILRALETSS